MKEKHKIFLGILFCAAVAGVPIYVLVDSSLSVPQSYADNHKNGILADWLLFKIGRTHQLFGRKRPAAKAFYRYYTRYPKSDLVETARFYEAGALEEEYPEEGLFLYLQYLEDYPEGKFVEEAEQGIHRIKVWHEELNEDEVWNRYCDTQLYDIAEDEDNEEETED